MYNMASNLIVFYIFMLAINLPSFYTFEFKVNETNYFSNKERLNFGDAIKFCLSRNGILPTKKDFHNLWEIRKNMNSSFWLGGRIQSISPNDDHEATVKFNDGSESQLRMYYS